jgi:hypothetical protein
MDNANNTPGFKSTQPSIQWEPEALLLEEMRLGRRVKAKVEVE